MLARSDASLNLSACLCLRDPITSFGPLAWLAGQPTGEGSMPSLPSATPSGLHSPGVHRGAPEFPAGLRPDQVFLRLTSEALPKTPVITDAGTVLHCSLLNMRTESTNQPTNRKQTLLLFLHTHTHVLLLRMSLVS